MRTSILCLGAVLVLYGSVTAITEKATMADGPLGSFYQSVGINVRIEGDCANLPLE